MWNNNNNNLSQYPYSNKSYNYSSNNPYTSQPQPMQYQQPNPPLQTQQVQNNIIWVKGKENARSMQLAPNSTVVLLDSQVGKFYIKTTDDIGLGRLRVFNYIEQPDEEYQTTQASSSPDLSNYVTRDQLQEIIKEIKDSNEQSISTVESKPNQPIIITRKQ